MLLTFAELLLKSPDSEAAKQHSQWLCARLVKAENRKELPVLDVAALCLQGVDEHLVAKEDFYAALAQLYAARGDSPKVLSSISQIIRGSFQWGTVADVVSSISRHAGA